MKYRCTCGEWLSDGVQPSLHRYALVSQADLAALAAEVAVLTDPAEVERAMVERLGERSSPYATAIDLCPACSRLLAFDSDGRPKTAVWVAETGGAAALRRSPAYEEARERARDVYGVDVDRD